MPKPLTPDEQHAAELRVKQAQQDYAKKAAPQDYAKAVAAFEDLKAQAAKTTTAASPKSGSAVRADWQCTPVYKWMLESIAWYAIFSGAVYATAGLIAGLTVVGIPAGVILGAVGSGKASKARGCFGGLTPTMKTAAQRPAGTPGGED